MHRPSESETIIRRLYQITNDFQKGFDIQMTQLLMMGLERFNLDIAILSKVDSENYTVLHCVTPEEVELESGATFDYSSTYCEVTCESGGPVYVEHCAESDVFARHPAYQSFGLESYIGIPIFIGETLFGTLNFSSATPYYRKFKEFDIDVMKLMASWIEVELERRMQQKQLQELNAKLEFQALNDPLTKLPNRRSLFRTLNVEIERLKDAQGEGSIAMVDIDWFKSINDRFGHQYGDEVLKNVAQVIASHVDDRNFVGRFGGEEFVLWYPNANSQEVELKLQQLLQAIRSIKLEGKSVTVSVGVCHFILSNNAEEGDKKSTLDRLISYSDKCLYEAKDKGRDQLISRHYRYQLTNEAI